MEYKIKSFGRFGEEEYSEIYVANEDTQIVFSDLGARMNQWLVPGSNGELENIVLGYEKAEQAAEGFSYYYGTTIGRVAGRISNGKFSLNGSNYQLPLNEGDNHLHGGTNSFDLGKWDYKIIELEDSIQVVFTKTFADGESGYPGELWVEVAHTYTEDNEWILEYRAKTTEDTLFNPTNHVYFNLNGDRKQSALNHQLQVSASGYVPVDDAGLPLGQIESVEGTPFDLREPTLVEDIVKADHPLIQLKNGLDHPFVFDTETKKLVKLSVADNSRQIVVNTDRPSVVIYTHQAVSDSFEINGKMIESYDGIAIETQVLPNAINETGFGDIVLKKQDEFYSKTSYRLS